MAPRVGDDIDSSEVEVEVTNQFEQIIGAESIRLMAQDPVKDRLESKKVWKSLTFGHGTARTKYRYLLWKARFEWFRQNTLKRDLADPFDGEELVRFLATMIKHLKSPIGGPIRSQHIVFAWKALEKYASWKFDEKKYGRLLTSSDHQRFASWLSDMELQGRLITGNKRERTWIGFNALSYLIASFFNHYTRKGTGNWDIVIVKALSVVLQAALGARAGDIALVSTAEDHQCLKWRDLNLYLTNNADGTVEPTFSKLKLTIDLAYVKGFKDVRNAVFRYHFSPLEDDSHRHVCPITLILVHALRHGLVNGTTLSDVLYGAATSRNTKGNINRVAWTHPDWPVLCRFTVASPYSCVTHAPALAKRMDRIMQEMGIIAGLLARPHAHALRAGAARDVSHLPIPASGNGLANEAVRDHLNHSYYTFFSGTTGRYVGESSREYYNERARYAAAATVETAKLPAFAAVPEPQAITRTAMAEVEAMRKEGGGSHEKTHESSLRRRVISQKYKEFQKSAECLPPTTVLAAAPVVISPISGSVGVYVLDNTINHIEVQLYGDDDSDSNNDGEHDNDSDGDDDSDDDGQSDDDDDDFDVTAVEIGLTAKAVSKREALELLNGVTSIEKYKEDKQDEETRVIPDSEDEESDGSELSLLEEIESGTSENPPTTTNTTTTVVAISSPSHYSPADTIATQHMTPEEWISHFSKVNIVRSFIFQDGWKPWVNNEKTFEDSIGKASIRGNSRDEPEPWLYRCSEHCRFLTHSFQAIEAHVRNCPNKLKGPSSGQHTLPQGSLLRCVVEGCDFQTVGGEKGLKRHVQGNHDWTAKPCEQGCEPTHLYKSKGAYKSHMRRVHSDRYPTYCHHPDCEENRERLFLTDTSYSIHLSDAHNLRAVTARKPFLPARTLTKWVRQPCFMPRCPSGTITMWSISACRQHLMNIHHLDEVDANRLIAQHEIREIRPLTNRPESMKRAETTCQKKSRELLERRVKPR